MKLLGLAFLFSLLLLSSATPVFALSTPSFPICTNPQGTLKAFYNTGTHGIAGSSATYTGSDTVYTVSDTTLTQCFCSTTGQGIQSNWWKASSLSDSDLAVLRSQGWIFIPDGSAWGLDSAPYMVQNTEYACVGGTGGGVVTSSGEVLGLATTGDALFVYAIFSLGIVFLTVGILTKRLTSS